MHRVVIDYVLVVNSLLFVLDSLIVSSDINQSHRKGVIRHSEDRTLQSLIAGKEHYSNI